MSLPISVKDLDHHAYAIVGGEAERAELLGILENERKIAIRGNPDLFDRAYQVLSIDEAREIKSFAETRPVGGNATDREEARKIFILTMTGITVEAQNALLKLLEEPPEYAHFFLILPSAHLLLPTVKSRLSLVGASSDAAPNLADGSIIKLAKEFLAAPRAKRLELVKSFMEEVSKEKRPKQDVVDLLNAIQEIVYAKGVSAASLPKLEAIETARKYMNDRGPSLKMLLEYVALAV